MSTLPTTQTGLRPTSVPLSSAHKPLETAPTALGQLTDCTPMLHDAEALNAHMRDEGYLLLRGFHDQADVLAARLSMFERLAAEGHLDLNHPLAEGVAAPDATVAFKYEIALKNPQVHQVVYGERMMAFFKHFLGGAARHFDYTWIRAVSPGLATPPHMDVVYMGRGTKRLFTVQSHREPAAEGRPNADRRRHGVHLRQSHRWQNRQKHSRRRLHGHR